MAFYFRAPGERPMQPMDRGHKAAHSSEAAMSALFQSINANTAVGAEEAAAAAEAARLREASVTGVAPQAGAVGVTGAQREGADLLSVNTAPNGTSEVAAAPDPSVLAEQLAQAAASYSQEFRHEH